MLFKKVEILSSTEGCKGVLKYTFIDGAESKLDITVIEPDLEEYLIAVTSTDAEIVQTIPKKYSLELTTSDRSINVTIADKEGKILMQNHYSSKSRQLITEAIAPKDEHREDEPILPRSEPRKIETKTDDIAERFGIKEFENTLETPNKNDSVIDKFLSDYETSEHNETLEKLFEGSKWLNADTNSAIGLLYNSQGITHVCFAVSGAENSPPTYDAEWLEGYWITYESTDDRE